MSGLFDHLIEHLPGYVIGGFLMMLLGFGILISAATERRDQHWAGVMATIKQHCELVEDAAYEGCRRRVLDSNETATY